MKTSAMTMLNVCLHFIIHFEESHTSALCTSGSSSILSQSVSEFSQDSTQWRHTSDPVSVPSATSDKSLPMNHSHTLLTLGSVPCT